MSQILKSNSSVGTIRSGLTAGQQGENTSSAYTTVQWALIDRSSPYHPRHRVVLSNEDSFWTSYIKAKYLDTFLRHHINNAASVRSSKSSCLNVNRLPLILPPSPSSRHQRLDSYVNENSLETFILAHSLPCFIRTHSLQETLSDNSMEQCIADNTAISNLVADVTCCWD